MKLIRKAILDFLKPLEGEGYFSGYTLCLYVNDVLKMRGMSAMHGTILRAMRELREIGKIAYTCIDYPHSVYKLQAIKEVRDE